MIRPFSMKVKNFFLLLFLYSPHESNLKKAFFKKEPDFTTTNIYNIYIFDFIQSTKNLKQEVHFTRGSKQIYKHTKSFCTHL